MKYFLISFITVLSLTAYASNENIKELFDPDNECHLSCVDITSMHRIDPQNLDDIKSMPFCSEEAAKLFKVMDTATEMPQEAVVLQNCLMSERISCIKRCNE